MNQHVKWLSMVALLALAPVTSRADQTNAVQNLSIRLSGISQGQTETNGNLVRTSLSFDRIGVTDIVKALSAATGNGFSDKASLVVVTPLGGGNSAIMVRDAGLSVDVTSFFVYEIRSGFVSSSLSNLKTGRSTRSDYSIQRLALVDSANYPGLRLHFDVQGIAVDTSTTNGSTRTDLETNVVGSGDQAGQTIILEGVFLVRGYSLEVVPTAPPPNA